MRRPTMVVLHHRFAHTCPVRYGQCEVRYMDHLRSYTSLEKTAIWHILGQSVHGYSQDVQIRPVNGLSQWEMVRWVTSDSFV